MKTQRGFTTILAIIIGLLIIGGGAYLYTSSDNDEIKNNESPSLTGEFVVYGNEPYTSYYLKIKNTSDEPILIKELTDNNAKVSWEGSVSVLNTDFVAECVYNRINCPDGNEKCFGGETNTTCDFGRGYKILPGEYEVLAPSIEDGFRGGEIKISIVGENSGLQSTGSFDLLLN